MSEQKEFYVQFDRLKYKQRSSTGVNSINNAHFFEKGWSSDGSQGGSKIYLPNDTVVSAIYMKSNNSSNVFRVDSASLGRLFEKAYVKTDGTEAYFLGAKIEDDAGFWISLPSNTPEEKLACSSGGECPFSGKAFKEDPAPPTGKDWKEVNAEYSISDKKRKK